MEGHSSNLWNDIADQIQRSARALTQEETAAKAFKNPSKIDQKLSKIGLGSALGASWGHLPPKTAPRKQKSRKVANGVRGPAPPGSKLGPKIHAKSIPKPSKRNTFLHLFSDRVRTPPGTDFHRIRGPKMEQKS